jgi:hypothetical protein
MDMNLTAMKSIEISSEIQKMQQNKNQTTDLPRKLLYVKIQEVSFKKFKFKEVNYRILNFRNIRK